MSDVAEQREGPEALGGLLSRTKFLTPSVDDQVVVRPALRAQLLAAIERHPLTVVAAPAGAGKTTLLAQWASAPGRWQPAWARLDAGDDDATMLAWTLVGCLRSLGSHSALRLEQVLASPGDTSPARLAHVASNDLADVPGAVLVLDDAHVLADEGALCLLDLLLDALHPDNRIVVAARRALDVSLPLRRARGQVGELGLEDLQLDEATIGQLLAQAGDPDAGKHASRMAEVTGGWAAAVRLLVPRFGAGAGHPDMPSADIDAWSRLQQFLLAELLDPQRDEVREFLVDTAVLDELTTGACAAVTGRTDVAQLMDRLPEETLLASRIVTPDGMVALRCQTWSLRSYASGSPSSAPLGRSASCIGGRQPPRPLPRPCSTCWTRATWTTLLGRCARSGGPSWRWARRTSLLPGSASGRSGRQTDGTDRLFRHRGSIASAPTTSRWRDP